MRKTKDKKDKYDVAREWYEGVAAVLQGKPRSLSESVHWIAGWDAGYAMRPQFHAPLNDYLVSVGMEAMKIIRLS